MGKLSCHVNLCVFAGALSECLPQSYTYLPGHVLEIALHLMLFGEIFCILRK